MKITFEKHFIGTDIGVNLATVSICIGIGISTEISIGSLRTLLEKTNTHGGICNIHSTRFTSGATLLPVYIWSTKQPVASAHACFSRGRMLD